jgi:hypothetical protein
MRAKTGVLRDALTGHFDDHHGYLLRMMCDRDGALTAQIDQLTAKIDEAIAPFARPVAQLDEIPGIGTTGAQEIIAEIGVEMARFPTAGHLVSWAKFAPQARQSAGKSKPGSTGKGNPWIGGTLGEAGIGAARTKTFPGARYHRLARRRGKQRALVAVGNSILVITWRRTRARRPARWPRRGSRFRVAAEAGGEFPGGLLVPAGQEEVLTAVRELRREPAADIAGADDGNRAVRERRPDHGRTLQVVNTTCPSAWLMAAPVAMSRTVHVLAQRTTMVRALASVATSRSPGRTPALTSCEPGSRKMLLVPGCLFPLEYRSAR